MPSVATSSTPPSYFSRALTGNWFQALLLAFVVGAITLFVQPLAEVPKNDDFSWARTAELFAQTGHIIYNDWGNPILLPHTFAGAAVIKLFGFSYTALSLFGIVSGMLFAGAVYLLARKCQISSPVSVMIVVIVTLNPVFLGVTPSFMSDVPTAFLCVAALLALSYALEPTDREKKRFDLNPLPFLLAVVFAFLAGANRQLFWITFLGAFGSLWGNITFRSRIRYLLPALLGTIIGAVALSLWFARQPHTVSLAFGAALGLLRNGQADMAAFYPYKLLNMGGLAVLPVAFLATIYRLKFSSPPRSRPVLAICLLISVAVLGLFYFTPSTAGEIRSGIYGITTFGQYLTERGTQIGGPFAHEVRPIILSFWQAQLLYVSGALGIGLVAFLLLTQSPVTNNDTSATCSTYLVIRAALIVSVLQIFVALPWYAGGPCYDRYLIGILPGFLLFCALQLPERVAIREPGTLFAALLIGYYAMGGILIASEYFAGMRCWAGLLADIQGRGVRREQIDAGFEWCGDTQIRQNTHINRPNQSDYDPFRQGNCASMPPFCPVMDAYLLVTYSPTAPDLTGVLSRNYLSADPKPVAQVNYASALPPYTRSLYVYRLRKGENRHLKLMAN